MLTNDHPLTQISDFALGLLSPAEQLQIQSHLQHCSPCRRRLQEERELLNETRKTIIAATQPSPARLRQLAPAPVRPQNRPLIRVLRPVMALSLGAMLFVALLQTYAAGPGAMTAHTPPTAVAATATHTPTTTASPDHEGRQQSDDSAGAPTLTTQPFGTPLAVISTFAQN